MKIIRTFTITECQVSWSLIDRTDLAESLSRNASSTLHISHGQLTTYGSVITSVMPKNGFFRRDVASMSIWFNTAHITAIFVEPDGSHGGPNGTMQNVEFEASDFEAIDAMVKQWAAANRGHLEHAQRWFDEAPWTKIKVGMTIDQAINVLNATGW